MSPKGESPPLVDLSSFMNEDHFHTDSASLACAHPELSEKEESDEWLSLGNEHSPMNTMSTQSAKGEPIVLPGLDSLTVPSFITRDDMKIEYRVVSCCGEEKTEVEIQ